jgi:hypothetical protein
MKIRNGFVSNSSSTSFMVALKNASKTSTKVKIELEVDLAEYGKVINNTKELNAYYDSEFGYSLEEAEESEEYVKARKAIEQGKTIIAGSFGDETDNAVEVLLCHKGIEDFIKDKNIEIIHSEAGY